MKYIYKQIKKDKDIILRGVLNTPEDFDGIDHIFTDFDQRLICFELMYNCFKSKRE